MVSETIFMRHTMKTITIGWILGLAISMPAQAAEQTFDLDRGKVKIEVPSGWQTAEGLYGIPVALMGPEKDGKRPILNVTATGVNDISVNLKNMKKEQQAYKDGRGRWLASVGGKALEFYSYENPKWPNVSDVHATGYRYQLGGQEYVERTYFVVCNNSLYHFNSLATAAQSKEHASTFERSLRSFSCK
jgi:hypothetical protein